MEVLYTYVLRLQEDKWYIGKTNDPFNRLMQHVNEEGAAWTRKFPPVQVHEVKPYASKYDEDNITLDYMEQYGIDNVRGGSYVQIVLPQGQKREIQRKRASANDACFNCGKSGHTVTSCPDESAESESEEQEELVGCTRCGRDSHDATKCYAKTHVAGGDVRESVKPKAKKQQKQKKREPSPAECQRCGRDSHDASTCYAKTIIPGFSPKKPRRRNSVKSDACFRCERSGHAEDDCYAKTRIDGTPI